MDILDKEDDYQRARNRSLSACEGIEETVLTIVSYDISWHGIVFELDYTHMAKF